MYTQLFGFSFSVAVLRTRMLFGDGLCVCPVDTGPACSRPWSHRRVSATDGTVLLSSGLLGPLKPPCGEVFTNSFHFFPQSAQEGVLQQFKMCHWIDCSRNEPADFYFTCEYEVCSQDAGSKRSAAG